MHARPRTPEQIKHLFGLLVDSQLEARAYESMPEDMHHDPEETALIRALGAAFSNLEDYYARTLEGIFGADRCLSEEYLKYLKEREARHGEICLVTSRERPR